MATDAREGQQARQEDTENEPRRVVPKLPEPPIRSEQDTREVDADTLLDMPEGSDTVQRTKMNG